MKVELREDFETRKNRAALACVESKKLRRVLLRYGMPIALVASGVLFHFEPERVSQFLSPPLLVFALALTILVMPYLQWIWPNRWIVTDDRIVVRGDRVMTIRKRWIGGWFVRKLGVPSGYYLLSVKTLWMSGATIMLREQEFPILEVARLLPSNKKREVPECLLPK